MLNTFSQSGFHSRCDELADTDAQLATIIRTHGYPPMWNRPNTFETLVHFILEQQVSLASALADRDIPRETHRDELLPVIERWKPNRTIATMLLWHYYLSTRARG